MTIAVFVFSLLGAMALGMPIAYALLVCGVALMGYLALIGGLPAFDSQIIAQRFVDGADNFPLLAVPFFLLAGEFMTAGGLTRSVSSAFTQKSGKAAGTKLAGLGSAADADLRIDGTGFAAQHALTEVVNVLAVWRDAPAAVRGTGQRA